MILSYIEFFTHFIVIIIALVFGFMAIQRSRRDAAQLIFGLFNFTLALWLIANYFALHSPIDSRLFVIRMLMVFVIGLVTSFFLFVFTFPKRSCSLSRNIILLIVGFAVAMMGMSLTPLLYKDPILIQPGHVIMPIPGKGMPAYALFILTLISLAFWKMVSMVRHSTGIDKLHWKMILYGFLIKFSLEVIFLFLFTNLFLNAFFIPFAPLFSLPFIFCTSFALFRYRLFDIKLILKKSILTIAFVGFSVGIIVAIFFVLEEFVFTHVPYPIVARPLVIAFIVGLSYPLIQAFVKRIIDFWIWEEKIDFGIVTDLMKDSVLKSEDIKQFSHFIIEDMRKRFGISSLIFLIRDQKFGTFVSEHPEQFKIRFSFGHPFIGFLKGLDRVFTLSHLRNFMESQTKEQRNGLDRVLRTLEKHKVDLVAPIGANDLMVGLLLIQRRDKNQPFSDEEIIAIRSYVNDAHPHLYYLLARNMFPEHAHWSFEKN